MLLVGSCEFDPMEASRKMKEDKLMDEKDIDIVNHPAHYQTKSGLETIDIIEAATEDLTGMEAVCTGNCIKYLCRWKKKNGVQDLEKARWYLNKLIDILKEEK